MATYRGCTTTINPPTQKWNLNLCLSHIAQFPLLRCFGMRFDNEMHCCEKHKLWPAPLQITILPWCPFTSLHWMGLTENRSLASLCLRKDADAETPPHLRSPSHMFFVKNCVWFKLCNASCFCKTLGEIFRGTKKWTLPCFHKVFLHRHKTWCFDSNVSIQLALSSQIEAHFTAWICCVAFGCRAISTLH